MIERDRINDHKSSQIVLVRHVISMPGDHIERTMRLLANKQLPLVLCDNFVILHVSIFVPGAGREEMPRIRQPVRSNRPQIGQSEVPTEHLQHISSRRLRNVNCKPHSLLNHADFVRFDDHLPEFSGDFQPSFLRN